MRGKGSCSCQIQDKTRVQLTLTFGNLTMMTTTLYRGVSRNRGILLAPGALSWLQKTHLTGVSASILGCTKKFVIVFEVS